MTNKVDISIPQELADKIEKKIKEMDFKSISDYVIYLLNQVVSEEELEIKKESEKVYSKEEEDEMKKKLKDLGYL